MKILLTGAAGKTGRAILGALASRAVTTFSLVRSHQQAEELQGFQGSEPVMGDLRNVDDWSRSLPELDAIYYICPNITPDELEIGKKLLALAKVKGVSRFIYHSVLHPQIEAMPHHWQKMRMEAAVFESSLPFTILQPCAYMQNILAGWKNIQNGQYITPYSVSARLSIVDLEDIGEAAATVICTEGHLNAIYELAGPEALSQTEVAAQLSQALEHNVNAVEQSRREWRDNAARIGMDEPQIDVLLKMFEYYDKFGLSGNCSTLERLLGRKATSFRQFLARILESGEYGSR